MTDATDDEGTFWMPRMVDGVLAVDYTVQSTNGHFRQAVYSISVSSDC